MADSSRPYRLVYISGSGRSGSTMLERIFHSAPGVTALGEFHCLWRLPPDEIACACGSAFAVDPFWKEVLRAARIGPAALDELRWLEGAVCRSTFLLRHGFALDSLGRDARVRRFVEFQRSLFGAIAEVSGSRVLVDSSKAGPRAWLLALDPATRFVHLHRDPADVLVSWRSAKFDPGLGAPMQRMPIARAALDWWKADWLAARLAPVLAREGRALARLDYARLCAEPRASMARLWEALGMAEELVSGGPEWLGPDSLRPGEGYHSLNGNPDRFERGPLRIAARRTDWSRVRPGERPLIRLAAGALRVAAPDWAG